MRAICANPASPLGENDFFRNQTGKLGLYHISSKTRTGKKKIREIPPWEWGGELLKLEPQMLRFLGTFSKRYPECAAFKSKHKNGIGAARKDDADFEPCTARLLISCRPRSGR